MAKHTAAAATTTEPAAASVVEEIQRPNEEAAGIAFRDAVLAWNAGAVTRSTRTDEDRNLFDQFDSLQDALSEAVITAEGWSPSPPDRVTALKALVDRYRFNFYREAIQHYTDGGTETWPAIESELHRRNAVAKVGEAIITQIDAMISAGYKRIANAREAERKLSELVAFWLTRPIVRALIVPLIATIDADTRRMTPRRGILEALTAEMELITHAQERAGETPRKPLSYHEFRIWLPTAKRLIEAEGDTT
jgi:hypothetical protein